MRLWLKNKQKEKHLEAILDGKEGWEDFHINIQMIFLEKLEILAVLGSFWPNKVLGRLFVPCVIPYLFHSCYICLILISIFFMWKWSAYACVHIPVYGGTCIKVCAGTCIFVLGSNVVSEVFFRSLYWGRVSYWTQSSVFGASLPNQLVPGSSVETSIVLWL